MGPGNDIRKNIIYKMVFVYIMILLITVAIIVQIIYLQSIPEEVWADKMRAERTENKYTKRGDILSSDGYYLAASVPVCSAFWDLQVVKPDTFNKYVDTLAACMSGYF